MPTPSLIAGMVSFQPGNREVDGGECLALANAVISVAGGRTALSGGGQTLGPPDAQGRPTNLCYASVNEFTTVAAGGDSVILPVAIPGVDVVIINDAASNSMNIFSYPGTNPITGSADVAIPATTGTPNSASTAIALAAGIPAYFTCVRAGFMKRII